MSILPAEQQRQHFRLKLDPPLCSDMTIVTINGKSLSIASTEVLIEDIGPGGLRFLSDLKLPIHSQIVLQFATEILSTSVQMYGYVVRYNNVMDGIYEYGVKFTMDEERHAELARVINRLAIRLRQSNVPPSGRFFDGDRMVFLRKSTDQ